MATRYVIGIDLGTTNCSLSFADTGAGEEAKLAPLPLPQLVAAGDVLERPLLPSFLYLPGANELPAGSLKLPWSDKLDYAVGVFARNQGEQAPTRLVASSKSWLCHAGIDRKSAVLPWKGPEGVRKISPLDAATRYLTHLREAWNYKLAGDVAENRLEAQEIVLTVPASFDAVARELTVEAARAAGLDQLTLIEEPQAAFYAWIDALQEGWRDQVEVGDLVLVVDIGGGTTDLTLIGVSEEAGQLALARLAVGAHILLGGDNMDLALAHVAAKQLGKLDQAQLLMLWHSARVAKETLFADAKLDKAPVTVLGRGSKVIGGTLRGELERGDVETTLLDGFFPSCPLGAEPMQQRTAGLQELGLPYASDPAITKHLAAFIQRNAEALADKLPGKKKRKSAFPSAVLFNGGVFKADALRERLVAVLNEWGKKAGAGPIKVLTGNDLDLAVARGAAYYGMVRRGKGIRIRGGTSRSYYVGIETSLPAVPGSPPPIKALCVAPFGMEEGTEVDMPDQEFGLIVGAPAEFRFLGSTIRHQDAPGTIVEDWQDQIDELAPLAMTLEAPGKEGNTVPVHLHSKVTEIGTLEIWCHGRDGKERWKLEYNVRG